MLTRLSALAFVLVVAAGAGTPSNDRFEGRELAVTTAFRGVWSALKSQS